VAPAPGSRHSNRGKQYPGEVFQKHWNEIGGIKNPVGVSKSLERDARDDKLASGRKEITLASQGGLWGESLREWGISNWTNAKIDVRTQQFRKLVKEGGGKKKKKPRYQRGGKGENEALTA